jgi:hypothetical protein
VFWFWRLSASDGGSGVDVTVLSSDGRIVVVVSFSWWRET